MGRKSASMLAVSGLLALVSLGVAPIAGASGRVPLTLSWGQAFSILGRSCGGIQEKSYSTGFAPNGYPSASVHLQTTCGGSGRGGGYKTTTYTAWASAVWDWFGSTRSYAAAAGPAEGAGAEATDAFGDRIYDEGSYAYLETGNPPLAAPAPPTGVTSAFYPIEVGEEEVLRFQVSWTPAPETASLIKSSTVTATPVNSSAPVLTATSTNPGWNTVILSPLAPRTTYRITVTDTDAEGTSEASAPIEAYSEGTPPPPPAAVSCEQSSGSISLSPGLEETPHVQSITVKGKLGECDGGAEGGTYTAHFQTTEEVTCSQLTTLFAEPNTTPAAVTVKWTPAEEGKSTGTLVFPLSEEYGQTLTGTLQGGPLKESLPVSAAALYESFSGGPTCGAPGKKGAKAKPVKKGTFSTSTFTVGA